MNDELWKPERGRNMKKTGQKLEITLCGKVVADFRDEKDLLDMAAARVTEWDSQAKHHARQAVNLALAAGAVLLAVRDRLPHGAFLAWVATNCGSVTPRTAQNYMRLAERAAAEFEASGGGGAPKALIGDRSLTDLYRDYGIVGREASEKWGGAREGAGRKAAAPDPREDAEKSWTLALVRFRDMPDTSYRFVPLNVAEGVIAELGAVCEKLKARVAELRNASE